MALYRFFQKKERHGVPTLSLCGTSSLSRKELERANNLVSRALCPGAGAGESANSTAASPGAHYNDYTAEERAQIGKYAAENGSTKASRRFSERLGRKVPESSVRRFKSEYLHRIKAMAGDRDGSEDISLVVNQLPKKARGRPLLLGEDMDKAVQDYIGAMRTIGGVINTTIVMAAAEGIVSARDVSKLTSHGGHIHITKTWAQSLLNRMGYVKRKCSNAGKVPVTRFEEIQEAFLADVTAEVVMNEIPDDLIVNWDQTALHLIPTGQWTMHHSGDKMVPITNSDDKRQITAVLAASMAGEYLPPQLIYAGKTERCHPRISAPDGWDIWHSHNHWSNEETMKRYIEMIILPFITRKRQALELDDTHPALVIFDCFRGQTTVDITSLLEQHNIISVQIPANCTDKLQPMDISVNKPVKDMLKARFQSWYASEVKKQLELVPVDQVNVDVSTTVIKSISASWIVSSWQAIEKQPQIAINGFRKAGLVDAISAARTSD